MFCKKCGQEMDDGAELCPSCGERGKTPAPGPVETARANPLFLAAVICLSVSALFQLIGLFQGNAAVGDALDMLGVGGLAGGVSVLYTLIGLCALAITAVTLVGLWFVYVSGLDSEKAPLLDQGLKLTGIGVMAELIYSAVSFGLAALAMLLVTIVGSSAVSGLEGVYGGSGIAGTVGAVGAVLFLLVAGIGALLVVFYLKARKAVAIARSTADTGAVTGVPSLFVAVMCFVLAGVAFLLLLLGGAGGFAAVVNSLAQIAANILFGILLIQYRAQVQPA